MHELLPQTQEAWAFATLLVTTVAGGVGWLVRWWADRRVHVATVEEKARADAAAALAAAQQRLVEAAERREKEANDRADKREETANKRLEAALAGLAGLTGVVTDLTATNKTMLDELKRANANVEAVLRDAPRRR